MMEADHVIVGAGSAGSALALRLAEAGRQVIVVEYGGSDAGPFINMPGALSYPMNMARYDWGFRSEPEPGLGGRRMAVPRGKVVGGSSSINGMVFVRGHRDDFDHWAEAGAAGWAYDDVLPYFRRMETFSGGADRWRGASGPLRVTRAEARHPLARAFLAAGAEAGFPLTSDVNGARQEGFGASDATIHAGRRVSAARAFLRPALATGRCRLVRALALRVVFEGHRATGVEIDRGGRREIVHARAGVILAASAINTPKLLMLSGIGPGAHLRAMGIETLADRPGVGANLQDHLEVYIQFSARHRNTLYRYWNLPGKAWVGLQWLLARRGPGASNQFEVGAFLRSAPDVPYPDIQFHFLPIAVRYDGRAVAEGHGFQAHVGPMRSKSRGEVRLAGPEPDAAPRIRFNYLSHPDDLPEFRVAIRLARRIFAQPSMAAQVKAELQPGPGVQDDDALDAFVRAHAESAYHPCGTARMGAADDPGAVVDPGCRVIGVEGLWVADSSIFPRITNGNLNAPSIMVGEKAADHILGRLAVPEPVAAAPGPAEVRLTG